MKRMIKTLLQFFPHIIYEYNMGEKTADIINNNIKP